MFSFLVRLNLRTAHVMINVYLLLVIITMIIIIKFVFKSFSNRKKGVKNINRVPKVSIIILIITGLLIVVQYVRPYQMDFSTATVGLSTANESNIDYTLTEKESEIIKEIVSRAAYKSTFGRTLYNSTINQVFEMRLMDTTSFDSLYFEMYDDGSSYIYSPSSHIRIEMTTLSDELFSEIIEVTEGKDVDESILTALERVLEQSMYISRKDSLLSSSEIEKNDLEQLNLEQQAFTINGLEVFKKAQLQSKVHRLLDGHKASVVGTSNYMHSSKTFSNETGQLSEFSTRFDINVFVVFDSKEGKIRSSVQGDVSFKQEHGLWLIDDLEYDFSDLEKDINY